jgi:hypothetical protein
VSYIKELPSIARHMHLRERIALSRKLGPALTGSEVDV